MVQLTQAHPRSPPSGPTNAEREQRPRDDGVVTDDLDLPLDAHPSVLMGLAVERWGPRGLMDAVHVFIARWTGATSPS